MQFWFPNTASRKKKEGKEIRKGGGELLRAKGC